MDYRKLSRYIASFALLAAPVVLPASAQPTEVIRSFNSRVLVQKDGLLDVDETIVMDFGIDSRHGIRRIIPVRYYTQKGTYATPTKLEKVTMDGGPVQYECSNQNTDLVLKIGSPYHEITGVHTYEIRYQVARAINFFDNEPEVYWNVTGNENPFPIRSATAQFVLPDGVDGENLQARSFVGVQGSKQQGSFTRESHEIDFQASNLSPGEGLTCAIRLPPGTVKIAQYSELLWWLMDWWPAVFTPWLALSLVLTNWWVNGRDPGNAYIAGVDWNPPKELTPAEVGTLVDESCDIADIVSTLVDLAARGYLKISERKTNDFTFSRSDYCFTKTEPEPDTSSLKIHERVFLSTLFGFGSPVYLSDLKYRFAPILPTLRDSIYAGLTERGYFVHNPDRTRQFYSSLGTVIVVAGLIAGALGLASNASASGLAWGVGLILSGLIVVLSAPAMPARTSKGVEACRQSIGFQRFVQKAEKERIRVLAKEDPTIFGRLLPYAMVLGAADQWANAFHDLMTQPPDWYEPAGYGQPNFVFSSTDFVNVLGDGMRTCAMTFTSMPPVQTSQSGLSSSGWSGGAGGFSGFIDFGGFSGGGFGGGGTSSW